jgi:hypothetical protein
MSEHNWCHGPECHTYSTVDRVRGVKGNKVLRTRKIKVNPNYRNNSWQYFCSQGCERDFWNTYGNEIRQIAPRTEPLETPIHDPKKVEHEGWGGHKWISTHIDKKQIT